MNVRWAAVLAWAALVAAVSLVPGRALPGPAIPGLDKLAHFVFYAVLALLAQMAARRPCLSCGLVVTAACGLFGAALEIVQRLLPGRSMSLADALANLLGAAAASAAYVLWARARSRARSSD